LGESWSSQQLAREGPLLKNKEKLGAKFYTEERLLGINGVANFIRRESAAETFL
jgi:hypothetical protein